MMRKLLLLSAFAVVLCGVTQAQNCSDVILDILQQSCPVNTTVDTVLCQCNCEGMTCSGLKIQNPFNCECMCPLGGLTCNETQVLDPDLCDCVEVDCPDNIPRNCSEGEEFDLGRCACVPICNTTCFYPMVLDQDSCQCVCDGDQRKCPPPLVYDNKTCFCRCPVELECISPQVFNNFTCECKCPLVIDCPIGSFFNFTACECQIACTNITCPDGQVFVDYDLCTCGCERELECGEGQFFDNSSCSCECLEVVDCPHGLTFDKETCGCACLNTDVVCCEGREFNNATCSCRCVNETRCPLGYVYDHDVCECVCAAMSSESVWVEESRRCWRDFHKIFNLFSCGCECPSFINCPRGKVQNPNTCLCMCPQQTCPPPKILQPENCQCECPYRRSCEPGKVFSEKSCRCECGKSPPCSHGQRRNPSTCRCECSSPHQSCPHGYSYDHAQCGCVCRVRSCSSGQTFNKVTCRCERTPCPNRACPAGKEMNKETCVCECSHVYRCHSYQRWDSVKCQCVALTTSTPPPTTSRPPPATPTTRSPSLGCRPRPCPHPRVWSGGVVCGCVCPVASCPKGKVLEHATCKCKCPQRCSEGQVIDEDTCQCSAQSAKNICASKRSQSLCQSAFRDISIPCYWSSNECKVHCCKPPSTPTQHSTLTCWGYSQSACTVTGRGYCEWIC